MVGLGYLSSCVEEEPIVSQSHHLMAKTCFRALKKGKISTIKTPQHVSYL